MCEGGRPTPRMSRLTLYALLGSAVYLLALTGGVWLLSQWRLVVLAPLELNEVGDLLAGALGPLALIWVVIGYFQQGKELQNSVEALNLQAEEMRNSVEQQKAMLEVTREGFEHELAQVQRTERERRRKLEPQFEFTAEGGSRTAGIIRNRIAITNVGGTVANVRLTFSPIPIEGVFPDRPFWKTGDTYQAMLQFRKSGPVGDGKLRITWRYEDDRYGECAFHIKSDEHKTTRLHFASIAG